MISSCGSRNAARVLVGMANKPFIKSYARVVRAASCSMATLVSSLPPSQFTAPAPATTTTHSANNNNTQSRYMWNSSFMDAQAATQVAVEIKRLFLVQSIRETHPQLSPPSSDDIRMSDDLQASLKHKYFLLTGEYLDDKDITVTAHEWSNVEMLEIELELLEQELYAIQEETNNANASELTGIERERVKALQATIEALQEEYETMSRRCPTPADLD